ncbi:hypothetical protein ES703_71681 [subsurface metagenome]
MSYPNLNEVWGVLVLQVKDEFQLNINIIVRKDIL